MLGPLSGYEGVLLIGVGGWVLLFAGLPALRDDKLVVRTVCSHRRVCRKAPSLSSTSYSHYSSRLDPLRPPPPLARACVCVCVPGRRAWRVDAQHDVHAVAVTGLSMACILQLGGGGGGGSAYDKDSGGVGWVQEIHVWMFSATYFFVDTADAVRGRRWKMVFAHHVPSLVLFSSNLVYPRMMELFYVSRILIIEVSTPLLTRCT
eukprot:COSAG01_NODE_10108_length_2249_cov_1.036744_3_plen_205_part_00